MTPETMNLPIIAAALFLVLALGAALIDLIWYCAPLRGKWPFPNANAHSRLRRLENARRVWFAQVRHRAR